jgi:TctA family transporter
VSAAGISCVVARRTAAGLAAASAALHTLMLGHVGTPAAAVLIAGMAVACLYCARELWLAGTTRAWTLVALMNLGMIAVHLPASGMHHVTHAVVKAVVPQSIMVTSATVVSLVEVAIAVAVLCYRTRGNAEVAARAD